jgi:hypothetical protein
MGSAMNASWIGLSAQRPDQLEKANGMPRRRRRSHSGLHPALL